MTLFFCSGELADIGPIHVAAYVAACIEALQTTAAKPTVKQHLAGIRTLFDWLISSPPEESGFEPSVRLWFGFNQANRARSGSEPKTSGISSRGAERKLVP